MVRLNIAANYLSFQRKDANCGIDRLLLWAEVRAVGRNGSLDLPHVLHVAPDCGKTTENNTPATMRTPTPPD